ncbi:uncharacterized protein LOC111319833 [Stylophora pistillata]|uniref:uncharacterized protein LOC111319833 n=1 Tax=Stylophora pistillata TaxID=50429 RepID=UPI000C057454|nr:uncharacterized protein LOC111319833 [Stylophora pistillata]
MAFKHEVAILAGGCFWCMQKPFDHLKGVISTVVGYTGGQTQNPNYDDVSSGNSGHYEAIKVVYDPGRISFKEILSVFWRNIDPFDATGQFCDKGDQYRAAIFYLNDSQKDVARMSRIQTEKTLGQKVETEIVPAIEFFEAEAYHQKYYAKNPIRYNFYRFSCGRDRRLEKIWGKEAG